jgi:hypothetical protein
MMGQERQRIWDLPPLASLRGNAAIYGLLGDSKARRRIAALGEMLELGEVITQPMRKLSLGRLMAYPPALRLLFRLMPIAFLPTMPAEAILEGACLPESAAEEHLTVRAGLTAAASLQQFGHDRHSLIPS